MGHYQRLDDLAWVAKHMPEECQLALARFVRVNRNWDGATWEDVLAVLLDCDNHLDVTEPLWDEGIERSSHIGVTLLYAYGGPPTVDEVRAVAARQ